jgi:hypothetical protein
MLRIGYSIDGRMKKLLFVSLLSIGASVAAQTVPQSRMQQIYEASRTPYKYGLVISPTTNHAKIDCPSVFREGNSWYMTYVLYNGKDGTDGRGYETWIAKSDDLLHWLTLGKVLNYPKDGWDLNQRGGFPALQDMQWGGSYALQKYKSRHWMTYIGGAGTGYEAVNKPLSIGLASTSGDITVPHQWDTYKSPILSYSDKGVQWWESLTQYKSTIYKIDKRYLGSRFVMFYNAGGKDATHPKGERIGIALSDDMEHWMRYVGNPVFEHDAEGTITGDAQIQRMGDVFVMYYFSAFNPSRPYNAFNTFAASYDLVHWTDWTGPDLIIPSKPYDDMFAHKSCVIKYKDTVYHFYCAVNHSGQRGIAVATSKRMGKSEVQFPTPDLTGHRMEISLDEGWKIGDTIFDVPFNLDDYYGVRQYEHGNLHGDTLAVKHFMVPNVTDKEFFIRFEGVGTYADVTLNGHFIGHYGVGRTTLTLNVTNEIRPGKENELKVKISHPSGITDMPWVCGGCSSEYGFSEGSQPFGIFRDVLLEITDKIRVEPFGTHIWNNASIDSLFVETELHNYTDTIAVLSLVSKICNANGGQVLRLSDDITLCAGETKIVRQTSPIKKMNLWSVKSPYLYTLNTIIKQNGKAVDDCNTSFGVRSISWPQARNDGDDRFLLNEKPVLINGTCEYEHEFGQSHAFSHEQIDARVKEVIGAGFNAFRDAHQPHNLYYQKAWDKNGILWWPQFSAHIWFDTPQFRESFKSHLVQWVKERRNSPSVILWGLQNESTLPADFAKECTELIRRLDPTCSTMRLVTTCNGGEGTDWNVIQNWSGVYGGNVETYDMELKRADQLLNGEYGAWRTLGNHTAKGHGEEQFCGILERKLLKSESVKDSVCGHFQWLLVSHDNPGRRQPDEALRRIDKVGPYNNKGLLSPWEQPTDAYYMYKSHEVSADKDPFVYIIRDGKYDRYYTNADSVRMGTECGMIRALAYRHGRVVAMDSVSALEKGRNIRNCILKPEEGYKYLYRVNCGGDNYTDEMGNFWMQDTQQWSSSWADKFADVNPYQTSQLNASAEVVGGTNDWPLFRTMRFGRHLLKYQFPVINGRYRVEMYFMEPWLGVGGGENTDAEGLRLFDIAINDSIVATNLDLWANAGHAVAYKRIYNVEVKNGKIEISFPHVRAGQAVISAIAIASKDGRATAKPRKPDFSWADFDKDTLITTPDSLLPPKTLSQSALKVEGVKQCKQGKLQAIQWAFNTGIAKVYTIRFRFKNPLGPKIYQVKLIDSKGIALYENNVTFVMTPLKKWRTTSITTGSYINAGAYRLQISGKELENLEFDNTTIE